MKEAIIYVARYRWPMRLVALGFVTILGVLRPSMMEMWRASGWLLGVGVAFVYLLAVLTVCETFLRRTWVTETGIRQRTMYGRVKYVPYATVRELVIQPQEALIVKYGDHGRLKIHAKEGNLDIIIKAVSRFLDPNIPVVTL